MAAIEDSDLVESESSVRPKKRKRGEDVKVKEKLKVKKRAKKANSSDSDFDDDLGRNMYNKSKPRPGQIENCDICEKRFTVTPYSKEGPDGGLLCTPCGKQMTKENKSADSKARKAAGTGRKRRQAESNRLDGVVKLGGKSLQDLCIEKVAQHATDVEELGDLPDNLIDRLSQIFSKRRVLDSRTLQLFLRSDLDVVAIHDAAKLEPENFKQMFALSPHVRKVVLRNAGQFKDDVMDYMIEKAPGISYLQLYGANLLTDEAWINLFAHAAGNLEAVKVQWCDASFRHRVIESMAANCQSIKRLKLKYCRLLTPDSIKSLSQLTNLEHVSLTFSISPETTHVEPLIESVGFQLKTLSLENTYNLDDDFIHLVGTHCKSLTKLRLAGSEGISDARLASLFTPGNPHVDGNGSVMPPLTFLDLNSTRHVDHKEPEGPEEPMGVADSAFIAIMSHSGKTLRHLDISSCRHISHAAFCEVFSPVENAKKYAELRTINVTFCSGVETNVIRGIFACCPKIEKIIAFGCFKIGEVVVPQGIAVIGVPRAHDAIENIGESGVNLEDALNMMGSMVEATA